MLLKPNPRPRLFIDKDSCPNLARQIQTYRSTVGTTGRNPRDAKPMPLKKDDHAPDALRYLLHSAIKGTSGEGIVVPQEPRIPESVRIRMPVGSRSRMKAE